MDEASVRRAAVADVAVIVALWKEMADFHAGRDRHYAYADDAELRFGEHVKVKLSEPTAFIAVAECQERIVAFCLAAVAEYPPVFKQRRYGAIWDLAVTASHRRQGIGQRLLDAVQKWFASQGIRRIEVRVAARNEMAKSFWRKAGFRPHMVSMSREV